MARSPSHRLRSPQLQKLPLQLHPLSPLALMLVILPGANPAAFTAQGWVLAVWLLAVVSVARVSFVWFERPMRERLRRWAEPERG